ncbi:MAG: hypothetical protein SOI38_08250 [Eggerthellaceae bacterium]|jgi:hypothetical protein
MANVKQHSNLTEAGAQRGSDHAMKSAQQEPVRDEASASHHPTRSNADAGQRPARGNATAQPTYHIHLKERDQHNVAMTASFIAYMMFFIGLVVTAIMGLNRLPLPGLWIAAFAVLAILNGLLLLHYRRWELNVKDGRVFETTTFGTVKDRGPLDAATRLKISRGSDISVYDDDRRLYDFALDMPGDVGELYDELKRIIDRNALLDR